MNTLKWVEDCENVGGYHPEGAVGEESEAPRDTQLATQTQNDHYFPAGSCFLLVRCFASLETKEPGQCDDDCGEGEEEDHRIVANVDDVMDVIVVNPAPVKSEINQLDTMKM